MNWDPASEFHAIWTAALAAVDPLLVLPPHLPAPPGGRLVVVGAGKGAARMGLAAEHRYGTPLEGLLLTMYGHEEVTMSLQVVQAGHPVPDEHGLEATLSILDMAESLTEDDMLLVLLSGGASSLLTAPRVPLRDKQHVTRDLLKSGAPIEDINCVRKHLSRIKGGQLAAAAYPARTVTLAISDVPGDKADVIASGPTVPDPTTLEEARSILDRYNIDVPAEINLALQEHNSETVKEGDERLSRADYILVARPKDAVSAAGQAARSLGYQIVCLGDNVEGEARDVAKAHARSARASVGQRIAILSGGELTVTGADTRFKGGRCREYALALAFELAGEAAIAGFAADTDGIDGSADAAGAYFAPGIIELSLAKGLSAESMLKEHRSGEFFTAMGTHFVTGPTRTNVGDLRVILINPGSE